jgi:hypothetical protein
MSDPFASQDYYVPVSTELIDTVTVGYKVVTDSALSDFEAAVNEAIDEGWQPHGGMNVICYDYVDRKGYEEIQRIYYQAMVRYGQPE